ncbi:MAG: hypothetical protein J6U43_06035, partial [Bacteroidales bacterium]|nr:hypothetical protein [Bacteroidales bacterium]
MKHNNIFIALLATLTLVACGGNKTCHVEALIDNMPEGKFYLVDKMAIEILDSTLVADGVVSFAHEVDTAFEAIIVDATHATPEMKFL